MAEDFNKLTQEQPPDPSAPDYPLRLNFYLERQLRLLRRQLGGLTEDVGDLEAGGGGGGVGGGGGTTIDPATTDPLLVNFTPGTVGVSLKYAREDHRHKLDPTINAIGVDTWTGAHTWTPSGNFVPVTINAPTSANMQVWHPQLGTDSVLTSAGDLGIGESVPTAGVSIRARSSSGSSIFTISPAPSLWIDAPTSLAAYADNAVIPTWPDLSGNSRDFVQDEAGGPKISTTTLAIGGKRAVFLDIDAPNGSGHLMHQSGGAYNVSGAYTVAVVWRANASGAGPFNMFGRRRTGSSTNEGMNFPAQGLTGTINAFYAGSSLTLSTALNIPPSSIHATVVRRNADNTHEVFHNGVSVTAGTPTDATALMIDGLFTLDADSDANTENSLAEMIVFPGALTPTAISTIFNYFTAKYGTSGGSPISTGAPMLQDWKTVLGAVDSIVDSNLNFGLGIATPLTKLHVRSTILPQLRIDNSGTSYYTTAVAATTGAVTFDAFGSVPAFSFSKPLTAASTLTAAVGIDLSTSGVIKSSVATAGNVFDLQDALGAGARTSGNVFKIGRAADSRLMMDVTWDGRFGFGYSSQVNIAQIGHVLGFLQTDNDSPVGAPHMVGILSFMRHSTTNASTNVTKLIGIVGMVGIDEVTRFQGTAAIGMSGTTFTTTNPTTAQAVSLIGVMGSNVGGGSLNNNTEANSLVSTGTSGLAIPKGNFSMVAAFAAREEVITSVAPTVFPLLSTGVTPYLGTHFYAPIPHWPSAGNVGADAGNVAYGEAWGIYGIGTSSAIVHKPRVTGFIRIPYPRRTTSNTTQATEAWFEPWANTATIRDAGVSSFGTGSGTVSGPAGGTTVGTTITGDGATLFSTELAVGTLVTFSTGVVRRVASIASASSMVVTPNLDTTLAAGTTFTYFTTRTKGGVYFDDGTNFLTGLQQCVADSGSARYVALVYPTGNFTTAGPAAGDGGVMSGLFGFTHLQDVTFDLGKNIITNGTTGTIIATSATTQKLSLFGKTPIVQPVGAGQAAAAAQGQQTLIDSTTGTAGTTLAAAIGAVYATDFPTIINWIASLAAQLALIKTDVANIKTLQDATRTAMVDFGSMKGAA